MRRQAVKYIVIFASAWLVVAPLAATALAQDVPGIEICTRESRLDRRTGCLQSNVEFLQQVIAKNALDAQQKLSAANRDIAALKEQVAGASRDVAALKEALAAMQARLDQLSKASLQAGPQGKPDPKPQGK
jgi:chromosome segregation ATPase